MLAMMLGFAKLYISLQVNFSHVFRGTLGSL
nr:MAG TPA: hypothetical protein [Caudoviricetes sp.]